MFRRHNDVTFMDLSLDLRDGDDWKVGPLRAMDYPQNITALATEPISGLLAIGTAGGTVYLFGGPGVETRLTLPDTVSVKFLQFAPSSFHLVCLDESSVLHVWDLAVYGRPKLLKSARFDATNSLAISPCHSHAFLALHSGEIKTYDLVCLRKSSYTIPNMWKLYQDKLLASGVPVTMTAESQMTVDTLPHPRDLNRLFVAYGGGVVLTDLTEHTTLRAYELILPPGAPGGFGYGSSDLLTHRRPEVTALTIHPAGHFFAVGYADGSLAFWAVEDEEKPLLLRTLDELDVNVVDQNLLNEHISQGREGKTTSPSEREPIFKLSWSGFQNSTDPRGGNTTLSILGGLIVGEANGLTIVQFPAFNPPEPPASTSPNPTRPVLHPVMRQAMRDSLDVMDSYFYFTQGIIQDYLLIPHKSPHFAGTFDPIAIILLTEGEGNTRTIEAYQYPPPAFLSNAPKTPANVATATVDPLNSLADTLKDLEENEDPKQLIIPAALSHGKSGVLGGQLFKIEKETYQTLAAGKSTEELMLPLTGGQAWADEFKANDLRLAKYQPHRILVTSHRDFTVCFDDISAQLLVAQRPTSLQSNFPDPLSDLTIDLGPVLLDSTVISRTSPALMEHTRIDNVYFAAEALETTVLLATGEVILYRLSGPRKPSTHRDASDEELIILDHVPSQRGFSPYLMLAPTLGPAEACAVSDIGLYSFVVSACLFFDQLSAPPGFLAVAYPNALFIVNMRGPEVLLRHENRNTKGKHAAGFLPGQPDPDGVASMVTNSLPLWDTTLIDRLFLLGPEPQVRLVVARMSGQYQIYTLTQTESSAQPWSCERPITVDGGVPNALPRGLFVLDSKTGVSLPAGHIRLALAGSGEPTVPSILVMVGARGARCFANLNGERIGKVDWGNKAGDVLGVQIIEKLGSHVLVVATTKHDALIYSLPQLEYIMTLKIPPILISSLSIEESGDFIAWYSHPASGTMHQATYSTFFDIRRAYDLPDIDLACTKPIVPAAPQPVSAGPASMLQLGSWFSFNQSMSGAQLDELLGGPNRPIPQPVQETRNFYNGADISAGASQVAAAAAETQANLYSRLTSALSERGQVLNDLEERFNALGQESKNMASQAKRLAAQQGAKSWFGL
ncbi:hypothetical protein DXG01_009721 [Tephrocybe rancida]|nr:hypothetical protein DXG01_009721 [Tephrocybe rancida]